MVGTKEKIGNFRWIICGVLFLATTINYIDRQVISILKPTIIHWPGWSELEYGRVVSFFQLAYAGMMLVAGALIDRIGIRKGFAIAITFWSLAAMGHAISGAVVSFIVWRVLLGLGEAANFPASIKTVAEWFPLRQRALATGIFNSGTNIGAFVTPFAVAWILSTLGSWRWVFIMTGAIGFLWLILWLIIYKRPEEHPRLSKEELAFIQSDPEQKIEKTPWLPLLEHKQTWAFTIGKGLTDPVWWVWLFWVPGFLNKKYGVDIKALGLPLVVIYSMASVGSISGGWLSAFFIKRGWSINGSRKIAMLACAVCVVPVIFAATATHVWTAVLLIGLACGAHQGWSANIFTLSSDMFPKRAVASVVGIGGAAGGISGFFIANIVGFILNKNPGNYLPVFIIAGFMYLAALLIIQVMVPKLEPAEIE
ncbi:MAG: MFS transporter [Chitinispirillaceae bacterium]|jgi:ACS family hexuronate transporter-like MFS transporter